MEPFIRLLESVLIIFYKVIEKKNVITVADAKPLLDSKAMAGLKELKQMAKSAGDKRTESDLDELIGSLQKGSNEKMDVFIKKLKSQKLRPA
jgi:hypothetical protein